MVAGRCDGWAVCCPKHVEQLRNIGIINSTTRLQLVGSFYEIFITMHGPMNVKLKYTIRKASKLHVHICLSFSDTCFYWINNRHYFSTVNASGVSIVLLRKSSDIWCCATAVERDNHECLPYFGKHWCLDLFDWESFAHQWVLFILNICHSFLTPCTPANCALYC
jgi:hypothetical protein